MVSINDLFHKTFEKTVKNVSKQSWKKVFSAAAQNVLESVYNSVKNLWDILFLYGTICI